MYAHAAALLQRQFLKLHTSALQSLAVAGYQTACARARAVALLTWFLYQTACPAGVSGYQTAKIE
jgi:hypothetical protein